MNDSRHNNQIKSTLASVNEALTDLGYELRGATEQAGAKVYEISVKGIDEPHYTLRFFENGVKTSETAMQYNRAELLSFVGGFVAHARALRNAPEPPVTLSSVKAEVGEMLDRVRALRLRFSDVPEARLRDVGENSRADLNKKATKAYNALSRVFSELRQTFGDLSDL